MAPQQRQFSSQRSRFTSRAHSQMGHSANNSLNSSLQHSLKLFEHSCVTCINKNLVQSKRLSQQQKQKEEINQRLQTMSKINSMKDFQKQFRHKKLLEATQFNKTMLSSHKQSLKDLKSHQDSRAIKLIQNQQKYLSQKQQNHHKSRTQLNLKYQHQLKKQLKEQRQKKAIESSRLKFEDPSEVNSLKVIEENQRYVMKANLQKKNCQQLNKSLIFEKSLTKHEEKQRNFNEDKRHLETVQSQFKSFTQFQPLQSSHYRASRSTLFSQQNPENAFTHLKRIQTEKNLSKITQRELNNNERALELKKFEEENIKTMKKKITSMKSYVEDLTSQLLEKRKRQTNEQNYRKNFQPKKSRVDYFTEEIKNEVSQCHGCDKSLEKKYFGV